MTFFTESEKLQRNDRTFIIAEIALSHDGSLGMAYAYIDAVAEIGADAIKFQMHLAEEESTYDEQFRIPFSYQDNSRLAYWQRTAFSFEQWKALAEYARKKNLVFLCTPFSLKAVALLEMLNIVAWKIGSGDIKNQPMLDAILKTRKPILLSTGMSNYAEIKEQVEKIKSKRYQLILFQCTSRYPTPLSAVGFNVLNEFRQRYGTSVGLSDHSGQIYPGLLAVAQKIDFLEVHVVFDKRQFGPDVSSSITIDQLKQIIEARNAFKEITEHFVDKDAEAKTLLEVRQLFDRSYALREECVQGAVISQDLLILKKPGTGFRLGQENQLIGKRLLRRVSKFEILKKEDLI